MCVLRRPPKKLPECYNKKYIYTRCKEAKNKEGGGRHRGGKGGEGVGVWRSGRVYYRQGTEGRDMEGIEGSKSMVARVCRMGRVGERAERKSNVGTIGTVARKEVCICSGLLLIFCLQF